MAAMSSQAMGISMLSSDDVVELIRFSQEKADIDQQIKLIEEQPRIDVFDGLRDYSSDDGVLVAAEASLAERERTIGRLASERDETAAKVERFNVSDMNRLRKVAKASSQGHMSARDTDLIEITLETIYSLDRLQKLLSSRRASLDLARQRLAWERRLCECWKEFGLVTRDLATFVENRARWSPSEYSRRVLQASTSSVSTDGGSPPRPVPLPSSSSNNNEHDNYGDPGRAKSLVSWQITGEMIELEAARLNLRIKALGQEAVLQAGAHLDAIIDQCQVPEKFIDEQEKLEEAVPDLVSRGSFATLLAEQWEKADLLYRKLKAIRRHARELDGSAVEGLGERPTKATADSLRGSMEWILDGLDAILVYDRQHLAAGSKTPALPSAFRPDVGPSSPTHPAYADQLLLNAELQRTLQKDAISTLKKVRLATSSVDRYHRGLQLFKSASASLERAQQAADALRGAEDDVQRQCRLSVEALNEGSATARFRNDAICLEPLLHCLEELDRAAYNAAQSHTEVLMTVGRCEAAGLADARKWLSADAALKDLALRQQASADGRSRVAGLVEKIQKTRELQVAITDEEQALETISSELEFSVARLAENLISSAQNSALEQHLAGLVDCAASKLAASKELVAKLAVDEALLAEYDGAAAVVRSELRGVARLTEKADLLEKLVRASEGLASQARGLHRASADGELAGVRLKEAKDVLDRQSADLQRDWAGHIEQAQEVAADITISLRTLRVEIDLFEQACVDSVRLSGFPSANAPPMDQLEALVRDRLNGLWIRLKADLDQLGERAKSLACLADTLRRLRAMLATFDDCSNALISCMDVMIEVSDEGSARPLAGSACHLDDPARTAAASDAILSLDEVGEGLQNLLASSAELQAAEARQARVSIEARLSENRRFRKLFDSYTVRQRDPAPVPPAAPSATTPRRAQASQRNLGLGHSTKQQQSSSIDRIRVAKGVRTGEKVASKPSKAESAHFAALLAKSRAGPTALQTIDEQGRLQMQQLVDLPGDGDLEAGQHFWTQLNIEVEDFRRLQSDSSHQRLGGKLRFLIRDTAIKSQRFRNLCAFNSAARAVDRHQSRLFQLADSVSGFAALGSSNFDQDGAFDSRHTSARSTPSSRQWERVEDEILELGTLLDRAKKASLRVRSDVRVRRRMAKLVRSTVEVTQTARAALYPNAANFDPDQSDDGLSICTSSSFGRLDRPNWDVASVGGLSRLRSASIERPRSSQDSPYTLSIPSRSGNGSRASVCSPLGTHIVTAAAAAAANTTPSDRAAPLTPSRIPRTPRQTRYSSQPLRLFTDKSPATADSPTMRTNDTSTIKTQPNRYKADPKNRLDVAVGRIVNRLPMTVKVSPVAKTPRPGFKDESGQYWVGDPEPKLCFCRILRSKTVMVRVGGGWQELSQFILQHYAHLAGMTVTPTASPAASHRTPTNSHSVSPWLRSASGSAQLTTSVAASATRPQQPMRTFGVPSVSASPLSYPRQRVESLPVRAMASPLEAFRIPSMMTVGNGKRSASSSSTVRSHASTSTLGEDDDAIEGVMDAKLSLY